MEGREYTGGGGCQSFCRLVGWWMVLDRMEWNTIEELGNLL